MAEAALPAFIETTTDATSHTSSASVWISYKRSNNQGDTQHQAVSTSSDVVVKLLSFNKSVDKSKDIKQKVYNLFDINEKMSIRLRNRKGHLVPIDEYLTSNKKEKPYTLEVFIPMIREPTRYDLALKESRLSSAYATKSIIERCKERVALLEKKSAERNMIENNNEEFNKKIAEMEGRLSLMESYLAQQKEAPWTGTIKRPLLW